MRLAIAAALVVCAAAPALAQATVELGRCVKKPVAGGNGFSAPGCTKLAFGAMAKYEWKSGAVKARFHSEEGLSTFETVKGTKVTCASDTDQGEYTGTATDTETITFNGCETSKLPCESAGQPAGRIVTTTLTSTLGVISQAKKQVGLDLEGEKGVFAAFECAGLPIVITGSVIGPITPINKMTVTSTVKFAQAKGKQKPEKFEGQPKDVLGCDISGGGSDQCAFTSTDVITNEEPLEIRLLPPAPVWWVEKGLLSGSEAIAEATTVTTPFELAMTGKDIVEPFTIQCTGVKIRGGMIEAPSARSEKAVVYEGCSVPGKPTCVVGTTETEPLTATLEGPAGAEKLRFVPQSGAEIATYHVTGCAVFGAYKANGVMICNYGGVETEALEHPLEFTAASGSNVTYQFNGKPKETAAPFTGTDKVHLQSGKNWSAF